jgi:hypothetical protein
MMELKAQENLQAAEAGKLVAQVLGLTVSK